jgi:hypothetical protein
MISKQNKMKYLIISMMRKKIMMMMSPKSKKNFQISKNSQSNKMILQTVNSNMIFKNPRKLFQAKKKFIIKY